VKLSAFIMRTAASPRLASLGEARLTPPTSATFPRELALLAKPRASGSSTAALRAAPQPFQHHGRARLDRSLKRSRGHHHMHFRDLDYECCVKGCRAGVIPGYDGNAG